MPSAFRTPKNLPEWIELDYHSRPRGLRRWRRRLAWALFLLCLIGVGVAAFVPGSKQLVQSAPVTSAHRMFNHDCSRCHQKSFATLRKLDPSHAFDHVVSDQTCLSCHDVPAHNRLAKNGTACAACHREHRGIESLTRVEDKQCAKCHGNLKEHRISGEAGFHQVDIRDFNSDHPEFAIHRNGVKDESRLKFSHKKHLAEEGLPGPDGKRIQLRCVDCHSTDDAGRYMKPVHYETHCASCHPLQVVLAGTFKGRDAEGQNELDKQVAIFSRKPALHDEPSTVRGELRERLVQFTQRFPDLRGRPREGLVVPDLIRGPGERRTHPADMEWTVQPGSTSDASKFIAGQLEVNANVLFQQGGGCIRCHHEENNGGREPVSSGLIKLEKTKIPTRWLAGTHGTSRFSHDRHRMLDCGQCHAASESTGAEDVLMPKIGTCQQCHTPKANVRSDCVLCHRYHDQTLPFERHRGMTVGECLGR